MSDLLEVMGLDKVLDKGEFVAMLMTLKPDAQTRQDIQRIVDRLSQM